MFVSQTQTGEPSVGSWPNGVTEATGNAAEMSPQEAREQQLMHNENDEPEQFSGGSSTFVQDVTEVYTQTFSELFLMAIMLLFSLCPPPSLKQEVRQGTALKR